MSLFNEPEQRPLNEVFPPGTPFRLVEGWVEGIATTATGAQRSLAKVLTSPVTDPALELEFGVWGTLCDQVRQIEPGELPAIVTLDNTTGVWLFKPHGPGPGEAAVPEAHLDPAVAQAPAAPVIPAAPAVDTTQQPAAQPAGQPAPMPPPPQKPPGTALDFATADPAPPLPELAAPKGTEIDPALAEAPAALPPAAAPKGTDLDESQAWSPGPPSAR